MLNTNTLNKKIFLVLAAAFCFIAIVFISPRVVHATSDVGAKSKDKCGSGNSKKEQACRAGFTGGYNDPSKKWKDLCKSYSGSEKSSCKSGVVAGRALRKADDKANPNSDSATLGNSTATNPCGSGKDAVDTHIDLGCLGADYDGPGGAIGDMAFALVRFLSYGVGVVVIIAIIASGIQYTTGEGNPEQTQAAKSRIQASIISLIVYVFLFSIVQFLVPGGLFTT